METAVTRLESMLVSGVDVGRTFVGQMFQKAESDLDYIQNRLEFELMKNLPDNPAAEENPAAVLDELSVVKSRYKMLCMQLKKFSIEQKESMKGIRAALENTMKVVQTLQQQADLECLPLSQEQTAAQQLTCLTVEEMESQVEEAIRPQSGSVEYFTDEENDYESH
uniref:Protein FAM33A n=1 Tax=Falco tinnunculus TaxID=100819 RepID=A0A8C4VEG5_FALTI